MIVKGGPDGSYSQKGFEFRLERSKGKTPYDALDFASAGKSISTLIYCLNLTG